MEVQNQHAMQCELVLSGGPACGRAFWVHAENCEGRILCMVIPHGIRAACYHSYKPMSDCYCRMPMDFAGWVPEMRYRIQFGNPREFWLHPLPEHDVRHSSTPGVMS